MNSHGRPPSEPAGAGGAPAARLAWLRRRGAVFAAAGAAVGLAAALWLGLGRLTQRDPPDDAAELEPAAAVNNPGYVGIAACAECHAERVAEFRLSRHFLACVPASEIRSRGFASGPSVHRARPPGMRFEMARTPAGLTVVGLEETKFGLRRLEYQIALAYGAGGSADEMYFAWQGDHLVNLPVAWLNTLGCWGNALDSIQPREATPACLDCHNTWVEHVPGTTNQFRRDGMLLGVTCERCHGPGREHVAFHRNHPGAPAHAIVQPAQLSRDRLLDLCVQCHGNVKPRAAPFSYRPGTPLEASFRLAVAKYPEDEPVANQQRYLRQSKCFQKSALTCTTCHDPHRPVDHQAMQRVCLICHEAAACKDQPRLPEALRGECVACHMPRRVWMNVRFHTAADEYVPVAARWDHRIAVHPEAKHKVLLDWLRRPGADPASLAQADRLGQELVRYWLEEADRRQRAHRLVGVVGALREALAVAAAPEVQQRWREAVARLTEFDRRVLEGNAAAPREPWVVIPLMERILAVKPDYAPARGELGAMYVLAGNLSEARRHLRQAAEDDPEDGYSVAALASLAYREGHWDEAAALFAKAADIEPRNAATRTAWGRTLLKLQRWAEAADQFRQALELQPREAAASTGLSTALRMLGRPHDALLPARRAVHWTEGQDGDALLALAEAQAAVGRWADADETFAQAAAVVEAGDPERAQTIHRRRERLRGP